MSIPLKTWDHSVHFKVQNRHPGHFKVKNGLQEGIK